jgi:glycosyltransferase involved in cell wall biosynthesis
MFSVVLGNYTYGDFLAEAINSFTTQFLSDFESTVGDDGATDGSLTEIAGSPESSICKR